MTPRSRPPSAGSFSIFLLDRLALELCNGDQLSKSLSLSTDLAVVSVLTATFSEPICLMAGGSTTNSILATLSKYIKWVDRSLKRWLGSASRFERKQKARNSGQETQYRRLYLTALVSSSYFSVNVQTPSQSSAGGFLIKCWLRSRCNSAALSLGSISSKIKANSFIAWRNLRLR